MKFKITNLELNDSIILEGIEEKIIKEFDKRFVENISKTKGLEHLCLDDHLILSANSPEDIKSFLLKSLRQQKKEVLKELRQKLLDMIDYLERKKYEPNIILDVVRNNLEFNKFEND